MSKPYLMVDDRENRNYKYRLSWYLPDEEDIGGSVGDEAFIEKDLSNPKFDRDCVVAYLTAKNAPGAQREEYGLHWETEAQAKTALRIVKGSAQSRHRSADAGLGTQGAS